MNKHVKGNRAERDVSDVRQRTIGAVWLAALAMLGVSIPLVAIMKSSSLPILVLLVAAATTVMIWKSGEKKEESSAEEIAALRRTITELEERLENVEVINRFEERLAEREARRKEEAERGGEEGGEEEERLVSSAGR